MRKIILSFLIVVLFFCNTFSLVNAYDVDADTDEVVLLISNWENLYLKYYNKERFVEVMKEDGELTKIKKEFLVRHNDTKEYFSEDDYVIVDPHGRYEEMLELFETVFDSKTAKAALNNSNLMFDDNGSYLDCTVYAGPSPIFINRDIERLKTIFGAKDLSDRLTITAISNNRLRVEFIYYIGTEEYSSYVIVVKTANGYRIGALDDLLFKEDRLADEGYRKYFLKEQFPPKTADAGVYITAAAGVIALCCAVICKKKIKT